MPPDAVNERRASDATEARSGESGHRAGRGGGLARTICSGASRRTRDSRSRQLGFEDFELDVQSGELRKSGVTSAESPMADIAGPAALLVPPGNAGALAWALNRILTDPGLVARLREKGPKSAAPYTWEASARLHLDAYRLALKVAEEGQ